MLIIIQWCLWTYEQEVGTHYLFYKLKKTGPSGEKHLSFICLHLVDVCIWKVMLSQQNNLFNWILIKGCPPGSPDPIKIGLSISGAIFLIGLLLLLIWKLLTMLYDSMEYSRFESEIQNPAWERVSKSVSCLSL